MCIKHVFFATSEAKIYMQITIFSGLWIFVEIGSLVAEKIFEWFLPYMGVAALLVIDPDAANKLPFPLPKEAPHKNLAVIGQTVFEKKMFEIVNKWTDAGACVNYKLT